MLRVRSLSIFTHCGFTSAILHDSEFLDDSYSLAMAEQLGSTPFLVLLYSCARTLRSSIYETVSNRPQHAGLLRITAACNMHLPLPFNAIESVIMMLFRKS